MSFKYVKYLTIRNKLYDSRFVSDSSYKFKKFHKLRCSSSRPISHIWLSVSSASTAYFNYFISESFKSRYLSQFALKSVRDLIRKPYRRLFQFFVFPFFGLTKKPAEVRMGKGKGSKIAFRAFPIKSGQIIGVLPRRFPTRFADINIKSRFKLYFGKFPFRVKHTFRVF